jgi:hypothetical protein
MPNVRLLRLGLILVLTGLARPQGVPSADQSFEAYLKSQPRELTPLSDSVKSDIKEQIAKSGAVDQLRFSSRSTEEQQQVLDAMVQQYLGELRGRKVSGRFSITEQAITMRDVRDYSFTAFFTTRIGPLLGHDTGFIAINSKPPNATVKVDGEEKGITPAKVVASLGRHQVEVRGTGINCALPVSVAKNQTSDISCP